MIADTIFENGVVHTVEASRPLAQAVAVTGDRIVYVGDDAGAASFKGPVTQVIDLQGRALLPGFIDGHNHGYLRAEEMFWVQLPKEPSLEGYRRATQDWLARNPDAKQVRALPFKLDFLLEQQRETGRLARELLDDVVGRDIPAVFITAGHHEIWVNTCALRNAGITSETPDPSGAVIDRHAVTKAPTGILREFAARKMITQKLPFPDFTVDEFKHALLDFQAKLAAPRGVTAIMMPIGYASSNVIEAQVELDAQERMTLHYSFLPWADESRGVEQVPELVALRKKYKGRGRLFTLDSVKIFATGVGSTFGLMVWDQEVLKDTAAALDKAGFRLYIHTIGPLSSYTKVLDALEHAQQANGKRDARHVITHVAAPANDEAARFKALDVIADGHPTPRRFFDAGVHCTSSADYPVRDFHPLQRIAAGVQSGVTLEQMIASHTIEGARMMFKEDEIGSIRVGKRADLVVMDRSLAGLSPDELKQAQVALTLFGGRAIFNGGPVTDIAGLEKPPVGCAGHLSAVSGFRR